MAIRERKPCKIEGCESKAVKVGQLCRKHYEDSTANGSPPDQKETTTPLPVDQSAPEGARKFHTITGWEATLHADALTKDSRLQCRVQMDKGTIEKYQGKLDDLPPVRVVYDGEKNWLCDGWHTYAARVAAGKPEIPCTISTGTFLDALKIAAGANEEHGLPRRAEDVRKAVLALLDENVKGNHGWTQAQLAAWAKVSQPRISQIASEREPVARVINPDNPRNPVGRPRKEANENGHANGQAVVVGVDWKALNADFGKLARFPDQLVVHYPDEKNKPEWHAANRLLNELAKIIKAWQKKLTKEEAT